MTDKKTEKPKKIAYVVSGRSLLTKIGCANAGAKVTPSMMASKTPESQLRVWYNQIRDGVLELPKTLKTELKEAEKTNEQITLEDFFAPPDDEDDGGEPGEPGEPDGKKQPHRPRGAKRK